eukprot:scaffold10.g2237.t1
MLGGMQGMGGGGPATDAPQQDTSEQIYISSLALLKMLKHGRAGVPLEVMGLMLGEFVDEYTVVDVFAMPQSGTGVSVEAVDPVFQTKMLDMLKQVGRPEMVVGWYHSHPGFGCWLSGVDVNTQQSFEALNARAVAVVVDPIQSVKGKVRPAGAARRGAARRGRREGWAHRRADGDAAAHCWAARRLGLAAPSPAVGPGARAAPAAGAQVVIDAFRCISPQTMMLGQEPRQTTSNVGHLNKPSIQALIHGLNRHYYSIAINYRKTELEERMLLNLQKHTWSKGLTLRNFEEHLQSNERLVAELRDLSAKYDKDVVEEEGVALERQVVAKAGKMDAKKRLEAGVGQLMSTNIVQCMGTMLDTIVF